MQNGYIIIVYEDDGREVEGQCSGLAKFVGAGLAHPKTEADNECLVSYLEDLGEDDIAVLKEEVQKHGRTARKQKPDIAPADDEGSGDEVADSTADVDPPVTTTDDPKDGWPPRITVDQKGSYYALTGSDGKAIESDEPSGKFHGEDAAQEAAWVYEKALTGGDSDAE